VRLLDPATIECPHWVISETSRQPARQVHPSTEPDRWDTSTAATCHKETELEYSGAVLMLRLAHEANLQGPGNVFRRLLTIG
jgi:hypothetical protein